MYVTSSRKIPVSTQSVWSLSNSLKHLDLNESFHFFLRGLLSLVTLSYLKGEHLRDTHTSTKSILTSI